MYKRQTYDAAVFANGGYFLNEDNTETGWDKKETIEGIQPWLDLVLDGLSPTLQQMTDTDPDKMCIRDRSVSALQKKLDIRVLNLRLQAE